MRSDLSFQASRAVVYHVIRGEASASIYLYLEEFFTFPFCSVHGIGQRRHEQQRRLGDATATEPGKRVVNLKANFIFCELRIFP